MKESQSHSTHKSVSINQINSPQEFYSKLTRLRRINYRGYVVNWRETAKVGLKFLYDQSDEEVLIYNGHPLGDFVSSELDELYISVKRFLVNGGMLKIVIEQDGNNHFKLPYSLSLLTNSEFTTRIKIKGTDPDFKQNLQRIINENKELEFKNVDFTLSSNSISRLQFDPVKNRALFFVHENRITKKLWNYFHSNFDELDNITN